MVLPEHPERVSSAAAGGSFSRDVSAGALWVWGGPVEPATAAKVEAPLNGRVCGRACLGSQDPALVPKAPIGLIKTESTKGRLKPLSD